MKIHPNDVTLEGLLLSLETEQRRIFLHVAGCGYCRSKLYYLPRRQPAVVPEGEPDYQAILERVRRLVERREALLGQERDEAPALFVELMRHPFSEQEARLREDVRFQTWGVLELLIERSWELAIPDPAGAEALALLALTLTGHLDPGRYPAELIEDMRARAWAYIANSRRGRSDLRGAEKAFEAAFEHLDSGSGDPVELGVLLDLRASLLRAQRDFQGSIGLLRQAIDRFVAAGDSHRAGRSMINLATVYERAMQPEEAIPLLLEAVEKIDPEREPRLLLCARHNLITNLAEMGRGLEAQRLYRETRPLYRSFAEPWVQNRRKWVRAKIARALGQISHAETLFLLARDGFVAEDIPYEAALVSLELATLYAEQGRTADLKRLAADMVPIFTSLRIHWEALAALTFFRNAVETEQASAAMIASVAGFLKRVEHDPDLRFEAPRTSAPPE